MIIEIMVVGVIASIALFLWSLLFATALVFPVKMAEFLLDEEVPLWKKIIVGLIFILLIGTLVTIAAI